MLPGVNTHQGLKVAGDGVLVGAGDEAEGARGLVLDEPGPARALDTGEGSVGLLLEVVKGAKVLVDGREELAGGLAAAALAVGGKVLPEERVVDVAAAVEVEQRRLGRSSLGVALGLGLGEGLDGRVEAGDVGLVVLGVVELHDFARDLGFERAVVV